jgi:hypothetical protein
LRGVERREDCFLTVSVVASNVEELSSRTGHAASESVDEGGAGRVVLECRGGVVVGRVGKFSATLGEASDVLAQALPWLLLAVAQLPLLVGARVRALEVPTNTWHRSVQSLIMSRGRCSSHVREESPR